MEIMNLFKLCSGLKMNVDKTNAVWLGSKAGSNEILCPDLSLHWTQNFNLLGIKFNAHLDNMIKDNFEEALIKTDSIIKRYHKWKLSLLGKICVIKTFIVPLFVHAMTVLPNPDSDTFARINTKIKKFLWGDGQVQVSLAQLSLNTEFGGLKLTHIETLATSLKLTWINRIYNTSGQWVHLYKSIIHETNDHQIWHLDNRSLVAFGRNIDNRFWKDVILGWANYTKDRTVHFEE